MTSGCVVVAVVFLPCVNVWLLQWWWLWLCWTEGCKSSRRKEGITYEESLCCCCFLDVVVI